VKSQARAITIKTWYKLRLEADGFTVRSFLDDVPLYTATDTEFPSGFGRITAGPNTNFCVRNIVVRALDRNAEAMIGVAVGTGVNGGYRLLHSPDVASQVIYVAPDGERFSVMERSADEAWLLVRIDSNGMQGWVRAVDVALQ
jgi:hypothetical protein